MWFVWWHLNQQILYVAYQCDKYISHWSYSCSCPLFEVCAQWVDNSIFKPHFSLVYASHFQVLKPTTKFHSSDWSVVNVLSIVFMHVPVVQQWIYKWKFKPKSCCYECKLQCCDMLWYLHHGVIVLLILLQSAAGACMWSYTHEP